MQLSASNIRAICWLAVVVLTLGSLALATASADEARLIPLPDQAVAVSAEVESELPAPQRILVQKTTAFPNRGNVLVTVELSAEGAAEKAAEGKDFITIGSEDAQIILRDDGRGGDPTAGDGRFTGIATVDDAEMAERGEEDSAALTTKAESSEFVFAGRSFGGAESVTPFDASAFLAGAQVELDTAIVVLDEDKKKGVKSAEPTEGAPAASTFSKEVAGLSLGAPGPSPGVTSTFQDRVLFIRDPAVVQDPTRTWNPCTGGNPNGVWTFKHLMTEMANQPASGIDPSTFVEQWLSTWTQNPGPTINGTTVTTRALMQKVIDNWRIDSGGGPLDLGKAPLRLLSIVSRLDLRSTTGGGGGYGANVTGNFLDAGEARFIFGVVIPPTWADTSGFIAPTPIAGTGCDALPFTIIFEYRVPKCDCFDVRSWARQWVALRNFTPGTAAYNSRLHRITEQFVRRNANPIRPNGSAIGQVRTNEVTLPQVAPFGNIVWELREFQLTQMPFSMLNESTTADTPSDVFNAVSPLFGGGTTFDSWVTGNIRPALVAAGNVEGPVPAVPLFFSGGNFLGANPQVPEANPGIITYHWDGTTLNLADNFTNWARHRASRNACSGCHRDETDTPFVHAEPSTPNMGPAIISGFLSGINNVPDPANGTPLRHFDDLLRRERDLRKLAKIRCFRFHPVALAHVTSALETERRLPDDLFGGEPPIPPEQQPALAVDDMRRNPITEVH